MERLASESPEPTLTEDQKAQLAEVDSKFRAKIAEKEIFLKAEIAKAIASGQLAAVQELEDQLRRELRRLEADREEAKQKIRRS